MLIANHRTIGRAALAATGLLTLAASGGALAARAYLPPGAPPIAAAPSAAAVTTPAATPIATPGSPATSGTLLFQDSFESGNLSATQNGVRWSHGNGGDSEERPAVVSGFARSGSHSLRFTYAAGGSGSDAWSEQRFALGHQLGEVYIRWYQWFPAGGEPSGPRWSHRNDAGADNNKFQRVWDDDYVNYRLKAGLCFHQYGNGDSSIAPKYGVNRQGVGTFGAREDFTGINDSRRGRWVKFQSHYKVDDGSGNGTIELWIDDQPAFSNTDLKMRPAGGAGNYFANGYLMGWANSGFSETSHTYIDDVAISTSYIP